MRIFGLTILSFVLIGCSEKEEPKLHETLHDAVEQEDLQAVEQLLAKGVIVDATNERGETALLVATHHNFVEIAQRLIDAGADVNVQDHIQDSPYLYAGAQGKTEILRYMLEHAEPDQTVYNRYGGNTLIPAAEKGHLENVKLLLEDGKVDIDHQNNFGYTALIEAVALTDGSQIYQDIVKVLLSYAADQNLRDNAGKTALDYATERDYKEMQELLSK